MELKNIRLVKGIDQAEGTNKKGEPWQKSTMLFETTGEKYNKQIALTFWGDLASTAAKYPIGTIVDAEVSINSREYNGKYYTDVSVNKIGVAANILIKADPFVKDDLPF